MRKNNFWFKQISKICISIIIMLSTLILLKAKPDIKQQFYQKVYENNISFATINSIYEKYAGSPLPFSDLFEKQTTTVFNEALQYEEQHKYLDGVKLVVTENYLVPSLDSGLVVFIGEKENYGNTIIIQQSNGIDVWYSNIDNLAVNMYDYIEQGQLLGEVISNELYLVFKKDGEILDHKKYI
ncbi:MAG: M23 family metallopeptidase [Firmicutes bacterium]|nr:M23 family metallopeptidase [Bacillota bacterium]